MIVLLAVLQSALALAVAVGLVALGLVGPAVALVLVSALLSFGAWDLSRAT